MLEYFAAVALDVEGTVTQMADERDRRLAQVDAKLAQVRKVQAEAIVRPSGWMRSCGKA